MTSTDRCPPCNTGLSVSRDSCARDGPSCESLICVPWAGLVGADRAGCYPGVPICRAHRTPRAGLRSGGSAVPRTRTAETARLGVAAVPRAGSPHPPRQLFLPPLAAALAAKVPCSVRDRPATAAALHLARRCSGHADLPADRHRSAPVCASLPSPLRPLAAFLHCEFSTAWPDPSAPFPGTVPLPKQLARRK